MGTAFTYQGRLEDASGPVDGECDFKFSLYGSLSENDQVGTTQDADDVSLTDGNFSVALDFGEGVFNGDARYLKIEVDCGEGFTAIGSRMHLTPAPYAQFAKTIYQRTIVVSPVGTAAENGTALLNALASIADASVNKPYLLKIEPGAYDLGTSSLQMEEGVDIEGSGEKTTLITASGYATNTLGTVMGANSSELRFLSVTNYGGGAHPYAIAIYNDSVNASAKYTHVTASASMGPTNIAIRNEDSSVIMTHVTILAGGPYDLSVGVWNDNSSPTIVGGEIYISDSESNYGVFNLNNSVPTLLNVDVTATLGSTCVGVHNTDSGATIRHSIIKAVECTDDYGVLNAASSGANTVVIQSSQVSAATYSIQNNTGYTTNIGATLLEWGSVNTLGGTTTCAGCYDDDYTFYPETCP
jgi:hypothetical protein